jgi:hypothetical protein
MYGEENPPAISHKNHQQNENTSSRAKKHLSFRTIHWLSTSYAHYPTTFQQLKKEEKGEKRPNRCF